MKKYFGLVAILCGYLIGSGTANAESLQITTPADWAAKGSLPSNVREIAGVRLSMDTLDGILGRFGTANRFRTNKGAAADDFLCYESKSHKFLVFGSGPMGGWSTITTIAYGAEPPADVRRNCVASTIDFDKLTKQSWLKSLPVLERTVRKKTKATRDGFHHVRFEREIKSTKGVKESLFCSSGAQAVTKDTTSIAFVQIWESCSR